MRGRWSTSWRWGSGWWSVRCSTLQHVQLDLMWTGVIGGTLAYGVHRLREAAA